MQMEHDFGEGPLDGTTAWGTGWFPGAAPPYAEGQRLAPLPHPDWSALRARFAALHALRDTLARNGQGQLPSGSFAGAAQAVLRGCRETDRAVNLFCSANSKAQEATIMAVAATPTSGDRGLQ